VEGDTTIRAAEDITKNVISFFSPIASSSYAVFDSTYKYMYDRFANTYRYIPMNGDIAGLCARTDINFFPWYSPAGTSRGAILGAVKLAYAPTKSQRDRLYTNRINPIIFSPGAGIILFGDKTGLGRTSAFARIIVRRLFIYLEDAISRAAKDVLFEFNDEITRTNFVNTIEPFLRDVQANRGIFDYVVICDETNNTAAVIDANEFKADAESKTVSVKAIPDGWMGLDIGPESLEYFKKELSDCKTVVWNGPMGVFEFEKFSKGTFGVAHALADVTSKGGITIIGGGDSVAAVNAAKLDSKMSHISTGGGASLEMLEGKELPGVSALDNA
jgi:hypothetical protein